MYLFLQAFISISFSLIPTTTALMFQFMIYNNTPVTYRHQHTPSADVHNSKQFRLTLIFHMALSKASLKSNVDKRPHF
jgi:hypothetical protein